MLQMEWQNLQLQEVEDHTNKEVKHRRFCKEAKESVWRW